MRIYIDSCKFGSGKYRTLLQVLDGGQVVYEGVMQNAKASIVEIDEVCSSSITLHFLVISSEIADKYETVNIYDINDDHLIQDKKSHDSFVDKLDYKKVTSGREDKGLPKEWIYSFDTEMSNISSDVQELFVIFPNKNDVDDIAVSQVINENVDTEQVCNLTEIELKVSLKKWIKTWMKNTSKTLFVSVILFAAIMLIDQNIDMYIGNKVYGLILALVLILPNIASISNLKNNLQVFETLKEHLRKSN